MDTIQALAILDHHASGLRTAPRLRVKQAARVSDELRKVRDGLAELIAAGNEKLRVERTQGVTDEEYDAATERFDAALASVQGGAA